MISKANLSVLVVLCGLTSTAVCQTNLTISLSARGLPNFDIFDGPPDPYLILTFFNDNSTSGINAGETNRPENTQNPDWGTTFTFNYTGDNSQKIMFDLWDEDVDSDDYMGYAEVRLSDIANTFGHNLEVPFVGDASQGRLFISATLNGTKTLVSSS